MDENVIKNKFLKDLSNKTWITMKARFTAAERMNKFYNYSNICISLSSAIIVCLGVVAFLPPNEALEQKISIVTFFESITILVISLLSTQAKFDKKGEIYHACACELTEYNDVLKLYIDQNKILNFEEKKSLVQEYNSIIKKYNLNHSTVDYYRARIVNENKTENRVSSCQRLENYIRWYFFNCGTIFILIPILLVLIIFII